VPHVQVTPAQISARVGTFTPDDLARGAALSAQLGADVRALATQITTALPLVLAMLLDSSAQVRERQLSLIAARMSPDVATAATAEYERVAAVPPLVRIPLVAIAMPNVVARPTQRLDALVGVLDELALADGTFTVHEYCLTRLVRAYVQDSLDPVRRSRPGRATVQQQQQAAVTLLAVVSAAGNDTAEAAQRAFAAGVTALGLPPQPFQPPRDFVTALDAVWAPLDALDPRHKKPLIEALAAAVADDGKLAVAEAELLRTACALVHCPIPALLS
jgi:uncharacterized tellurite resistance protein B-like protein